MHRPLPPPRFLRFSQHSFLRVLRLLFQHSCLRVHRPHRKLPTSPPADQIVPAGVVVWFASSSPPQGYLICDGRGASRIAYPALFAVIGTTFGAPSTTTFNLPDLRGEFIRGMDRGRGVDIGRGFGTSQPDAFQDHIHSMPPQYYRGASPSGTRLFIAADTNGAQLASNGTGTPSTGNHGSETRPRNVALLPCIKA